MTKYTKLLIARHSPQNKCNVTDGEVLYLSPRMNVPMRPHVSHYFLSTRDRKTRSRYGWVKEVAPFDLGEFIARFLPGSDLSRQESTAIETMLRSVADLAEGAPVAATYSARGVEKRDMELDVHRVFFYVPRR
jgi:hypothetical protein